MKKRAFTTVISMIAFAGGLSPVWADGFKIHDLIPIKKQFWSIFDASAHHAEEQTNFRMSCCGMNDDQHLMIAIDRRVDEEGQETEQTRLTLLRWMALPKRSGLKSRPLTLRLQPDGFCTYQMPGQALKA